VAGYLIVIGYCVRLLQNVRDGNPRPLPEWDQWGDDLIRGFKLAVAGLVWSLPLIILSVPVGIGSAIADSRDSGANFFGSMILLCGACLVFLYGLFLSVAMPGFTLAFARDEQISSGVQFTKIIDWTRQNLGQVIIVTVIYWVASFVISLIAGIVGFLLCIIGLIITIPLGVLVTYLFQFHLYGQLGRTYPMDSDTAIDYRSNFGGDAVVDPGPGSPPEPDRPPTIPV
jgi:hypothetical protein